MVLVHWKEQRFHIPKFRENCAAFTRSIPRITFIPVTCDWNSSPTLEAEDPRFPNLDWTQAKTGAGLIQCLGPICINLFAENHCYNMDVESLRSTGAMRFQVPNNLRAPSLLLQDSRLKGMLSADPKARYGSWRATFGKKLEIWSILFRIVCHFVGSYLLRLFW